MNATVLKVFEVVKLIAGGRFHRAQRRAGSFRPAASPAYQREPVYADKFCNFTGRKANRAHLRVPFKEEPVFV